jgi:hypothetical protein
MFTSKFAVAQNVVVKASIDTTSILIGQQFHLNLDVSFRKNATINWPVIADSIEKLQVVQHGKIDTVNNTDFIQLRQSMLVTGFDSGVYNIPGFQFSYKNQNDTTQYFAETNPLAITINTVPVDTTKEIRDIKAPIEVPYTFADFIPYIIGAILLGLLIYGIVYFIRKSRQKTVTPEKYIPKIPAHEIAISELMKLREEKLWQQGNIKEYYTRLTDIVRTYIERRYKINALEFTTDELMNSIAMKKLDTDNYSKLKFTLETADMVKFAKATPLPDEHELSMSNSFEFVNATKPVVQPAVVKEVVQQ